MNVNGLIEKYQQIISESVGGVKIDDIPRHKQTLVARMAHNSLVKRGIVDESGEVTVDNQVGVGNIHFPANPASNYADFATNATGSADIGVVRMGMAMAIAATTVGFDLLPTIPVNRSLILLEYMDVIYAGGRLDQTIDDAPTYITVTSPQLSAMNAAVNGATFHTVPATTGGVSAQLRIVKRAKYENNAFICQVMRLGTLAYTDNTQANNTFTVNAATVLNAVFAANHTARVIFSTNDSIACTDMTIDYTVANADHVEGFTARGNEASYEPMTREVAESGVTTNMIQLRTYSKPVQTKSYEVGGIVSRQQERQFREKGLDAIPIIKQNMQRETMQSINNDILTRIRRLGVSAHFMMFNSADNVNLNLYFGTTAGTGKALSTFNGSAMIDKQGVDRTAAFGTIANATGNTSSENSMTRAAKLRSRIIAACHIIGYQSRYGAGDAVVLNSQLMIAIKDSIGYKDFTHSNTINQSKNALYFAGELSGIKVFCDPKLAFNDLTVTCLRTNKDVDADNFASLNEGLVFLPQDLAASVDMIAEGTASYKFLLESIYALAEVGVHPELAYLTFKVATDYDQFA